MLSALYFRVDLFLIEWWKGTEAVALYNAIFRLVDALRLFPAAVLAVVFPELCRDYSWKTLTWTCFGLFGLAVGLALVSGGWSDTLVEFLYGDGYREAVPALKILLLALPLLFVNFALTHQLMAWNLQRFYAFICAGALLYNLGLNWLLIPKLSIVGAAWSTLGTEVFLTTGCIWLLIRKGARE
ncbi:polysaccharide biosynthesis C-terminal domain-containing protein, partial [Acidobacteria bacterium AH-259-G07]|nr:polysaccharide biosynthesis C-terminal domain-containing protein [Acidobacteria bacterium AH-259-G07]